MNDKEEVINYQSPIYLQLREIIRSKIEEGRVPSGYKHTLRE